MMMQQKKKRIPKFENPLEQSEYYRNAVLNYIGFKMRTRQEVVRYLMSKECPEEICTEILEFLESYQYVDDASYTRHYISQSRNIQHWSQKDITNRLRQKGVDPDIIKQAFDETPEGAEEQEARRVLEKKLKSSSRPDAKKIAAFMMRKGFRYDIVRRLIEEVMDDEMETWE